VLDLREGGGEGKGGRIRGRGVMRREGKGGEGREGKGVEEGEGKWKGGEPLYC